MEPTHYFVIVVVPCVMILMTSQCLVLLLKNQDAYHRNMKKNILSIFFLMTRNDPYLLEEVNVTHLVL